MAAALPSEPVWRARRPLGPRLLGGAAIVALIAGIWWASTQQSTVTRKTAEDSVLIPLVPPPPPPPPPEQPRPIEKPEDVPPPPLDQPQPTPQAPSPTPQAAPAAGQAVSIDGPAQAGGDAFSIGAGSGGGMRGGGAIGTGIGGFNRAAYAAYLEGEIRRVVAAEPALRMAVLRAKARLWIDGSGRITRVEIGDAGTASDKTGDKAGDKAEAIRTALAGRTVRAPDASLAMPVQLSLELRRH